MSDQPEDPPDPSRLVASSLLFGVAQNTQDGRLWAQLTLRCPECGLLVWRIPGHHLKSVVRALQELQETHPALVTDEPEIIERVRLATEPPTPPGSKKVN